MFMESEEDRYMSVIEEKKEQYIDPAWGYKSGGYPIFVAVLGIACIFAIVVKLYPMAVVWAVLFILTLLSTLKARKIKKEVMTFRDEMLTMPCVKGKITNIEERPFVFGMELSPDKMKFFGPKTRTYRVYVSYEDPATSMTKEVMSQLYDQHRLYTYDMKCEARTVAERRKAIFDENADVYVSSDGRASVELISRPLT